MTKHTSKQVTGETIDKIQSNKKGKPNRSRTFTVAEQHNNTYYPSPPAASKVNQIISSITEETFSSTQTIIDQIRRGFKPIAIDNLGKWLVLPQSELSTLTDIPVRTLARRKKTGRLHADESERVYRLATLLELAETVLDEHSVALNWLKTPKKALNGHTPLDYADTEIGINEVKQLLNRIEYGVFS